MCTFLNANRLTLIIPCGMISGVKRMVSDGVKEMGTITVKLNTSEACKWAVRLHGGKLDQSIGQLLLELGESIIDGKTPSFVSENKVEFLLERNGFSLGGITYYNPEVKTIRTPEDDIRNESYRFGVACRNSGFDFGQFIDAFKRVYEYDASNIKAARYGFEGLDFE